MTATASGSVATEVLKLRTADGAEIPAVLYAPTPAPKYAVILMHPVVDFHQHYAAQPLAESGLMVLCINSRYARFEHAVIMERLLLDMAEGVKLLRRRGCTGIGLIGNSGGGPLAAFYQSQATSKNITSTPDGRPFDLLKYELPPADAVIELNAHLGRHIVTTLLLDPSVTDEADMFSVDPSLDMYDPRNGPPYDRDWLRRYRAAQIARSNRITEFARTRLAEVERRGRELTLDQTATEGQQVGYNGIDEPFIVYRTSADPRALDLTIDPSDRKGGAGTWGPALQMNWSVTSIGRLTTLRSWLSQYSYHASNADGPKHLARTNVPVLVLIATADAGCHESDAQAYFEAAPTSDKQLYRIKDATHFMKGQPDKIAEVTRVISGWIRERF
jgi:pimeloyl-ACP methyl ester carboxylesterase